MEHFLCCHIDGNCDCNWLPATRRGGVNELDRADEERLRCWTKSISHQNTILNTMQANHYKTHQDFSNKEHTNVSNLASSAARDQTQVGSSETTLLASLSYEDIENIHAPELNGSIDTKEVLLSVDDLKNASKELNNWETLKISIPDNKDSNRTILFNLRGKKHKIRASHFEAFPETRLGILVKSTDVGEILELCDHFYPGQPPEYYFDRNSSSFNAILDIYRTGLLHLSSDMCALVLQKELEFWRIDELTIEPCCALKYFPKIEVRSLHNTIKVKDQLNS